VGTASLEIDSAAGDHIEGYFDNIPHHEALGAISFINQRRAEMQPHPAKVVANSTHNINK